MKWLGRILFILAFIGLVILAALPYRGLFFQKWERFQEVWRLVNNNASSTQKVDTGKSTSKDLVIDRDHNALLPDTNVVKMELSSIASEDFFIAEARRRAKEDPESAMAWLQSEAAGKDRLRGMLEIVALWAAEDAESALLWLESNAQGLARLETMHSGIELWSQQDPEAAASWIDGMVNDGSKLAAAKTLAANWASQSAKEASEWVAGLPPGNLRSSTAQALLESWAVTDPKAAAIWAFSEAEFNGNAELFNQSMQYYAEANPEEAGQLLRAVTEAHEVPGSVDAYVRALAQENPEKALDWQAGLSLDDPLNNITNLETIMQEWGRTDSVAASAWLSEAPLGPQRDAAIVGFTKTISEFDPEVAVAWSSSISEPNQRVKVLTQNFQNWEATQPEQAREWLHNAKLEPALRGLLIDISGTE